MVGLSLNTDSPSFCRRCGTLRRSHGRGAKLPCSNCLKNLPYLRLHFCINQIKALSSMLLISCVLIHSVMSDSLWPHGLQPARLLCPWGFSRQEYWSGMPCPPPGDLPDPGIEPGSPALQADSLPAELPGMLSLFHNPAKVSLLGGSWDNS